MATRCELDTCACVLLFTFNLDGTLASTTAERQCAAHAGKDPEIAHQENILKNRVMGLIADNYPDAAPVWSFTTDRQLQILTLVAADGLQGALDGAFGAGNVTVTS